MIDTNHNTNEYNSTSTEPRFIGASSTKFIMCGFPRRSVAGYPTFKINFIRMKKSAGILLYRITDLKPEVFLVHPGGPFWAKKEIHAWSVPKGEFNEDEDPLDAAKREFEEETGLAISGSFTELSPIRQKSGKLVYCYACEGDIDPGLIRSNSFEMEWPMKSGRMQTFPEIDRGKWFGTTEAKLKIIEAQGAFIDELIEKTGSIS